MKNCLILIAFVFSTFVVSQEEEFEMEHQLSLSSGITFVPKTIDNQGNRDFTFVPTIGLDYNFEFHRLMAVGLINEFEFSKYFIEKDSTNELEREYAYTGLITYTIKPFKNFGIYIGGGAEFDKHRILPCITGGLEYELSFGKKWFGKAAIQYNYLFEYSSIGFQIGFGYAFSSSNEE